MNAAENGAVWITAVAGDANPHAPRINFHANSRIKSAATLTFRQSVSAFVYECTKACAQMQRMGGSELYISVLLSYQCLQKSMLASTKSASTSGRFFLGCMPQIVSAHAVSVAKPLAALKKVKTLTNDLQEILTVRSEPKGSTEHVLARELTDMPIRIVQVVHWSGEIASFQWRSVVMPGIFK